MTLKCHCGNVAAGVCNCIICLPYSVAYCERCLAEGIEAYWLICASLYCILPGPEVKREQAPDFIREEYLEIIDRSLEFHGRSWTEAMEAAWES
jgi:hypothetical protein